MAGTAPNSVSTVGFITLALFTTGFVLIDKGSVTGLFRSATIPSNRYAAVQHKAILRQLQVKFR